MPRLPLVRSVPDVRERIVRLALDEPALSRLGWNANRFHRSRSAHGLRHRSAVFGDEHAAHAVESPNTIYVLPDDFDAGCSSRFYRPMQFINRRFLDAKQAIFAIGLSHGLETTSQFRTSVMNVGAIRVASARQ